MSAALAQSILFTVAAVATVIWVFGLWFLVSSARMGIPEPSTDHFGQIEQVPKHAILGSVEVDGQPNVLVEKLGVLLVRQAPSSVKIVEKTRDRLAFELIAPMRGAMLPQRGQLYFTSLGSGRSRIDYAIELPFLRWLLRLGGLFLALGLIALVVGGWVIYEYCLPSPEAAIRTQAIQIAQVAHFLWPPFLFGGLYRQKRRLMKEGLETLLIETSADT